MVQFVSLEEAAACVSDGASLALGGMTLYRRPVAFVTALLRRQRLPIDLTLVNFTAGYESDLLVGAGCVRSIRSVYFGLESFGFAPMFTQAAQNGIIDIIEETEMSMVLGLRAKMSGVSYLPSRAWVGTDLPGLRPDVQTMTDPYTQETLMAFPAISIDLAVLHGLEADREGNIRLNNNIGIDLELVYTADMVIVTVERMVDSIQPSVDSTLLPHPGADMIAVAPRGSWPTSCYPDYPVDGKEILRYIDSCAAGEFAPYFANLRPPDVTGI
jgi:glutaconate CoA-transferase subunit A